MRKRRNGNSDNVEQICEKDCEVVMDSHEGKSANTCYSDSYWKPTSEAPMRYQGIS